MASKGPGPVILPKPRQYQVDKTSEYTSEHSEYDEHHCCPPKVECHGLPGKTQFRVEPPVIKECVERCGYEITKCHQPPCRPRGRVPETKEYTPEYGHKPEYAEILGKLKPGYGESDFDHQINDSLRIWPHCTVGKIWVGANHNYDTPLWTGTGVLVGCDLILTSSHIVPWDLPGWWMRFAPGYAQGSYPFGSSYVADIRGYTPSAAGTADDFVVCKLYNPLGDKCGWMAVEGFGSNQEYSGKVWNEVGYSPLVEHGEVQLFDGDEKIKQVKSEGEFKLLEAHGDTWGWSGGILWGWHHDCACVIGVLCGTKEELCIFLKAPWAGGLGMVELVHWARTNWQ